MGVKINRLPDVKFINGGFFIYTFDIFAHLKKIGMKITYALKLFLGICLFAFTVADVFGQNTSDTNTAANLPPYVQVYYIMRIA